MGQGNIPVISWRIAVSYFNFLPLSNAANFDLTFDYLGAFTE